MRSEPMTSRAVEIGLRGESVTSRVVETGLRGEPVTSRVVETGLRSPQEVQNLPIGVFTQFEARRRLCTQCPAEKRGR